MSKVTNDAAVRLAAAVNNEAGANKAKSFSQLVNDFRFDDQEIYGGAGDDQLSGGFGNDTLSGHEGNDVLRGGIGNDLLSGGWGDDVLHGGFGKDELRTGRGDDTVYGGRGDDKIFVSGPGDKVIDGGTGNDTLVIKGNKEDYVTLIDFGGTKVLRAKDGSVIEARNVENIEFEEATVTTMAMGEEDSDGSPLPMLPGDGIIFITAAIGEEDGGSMGDPLSESDLIGASGVRLPSSGHPIGEEG